jgi:hypothetical protein
MEGASTSGAIGERQGTKMSVLILILGSLALAAIVAGVFMAEASLIAAAVILLTTMGIVMSKADRRADDPSGTAGPRPLLHRLREFLDRRKA